MEKQLIQLKENRADLVKQADALVQLAKKEDREPTDQEEKDFDDLESQIKALKPKIERAERMVAMEQKAAQNKAPQKKDTPEQKVAKRYSITKAIRERLDGGNLTGLEKEMQEAAGNEARNCGVSGISSRGVAMPSFLLKAMSTAEKRALSVGSATSAGNLVGTELREHIPALTPTMQVVDLGADVWSGLNGDIDLTRETNHDVANWAGETDAAPEKTMTTEVVQLRPKRLTAKSTISRQLLFQSSVQADKIVRSRLENSIALAVDIAALIGSGAGNQPTGLLNLSGVGAAYAGGAANNGVNVDGAAPIFDDLVNLENEVAVDNALLGNLAYLIPPAVRRKYKLTKLDAGSGQFVWPVNSKELNGYLAAVSTQVPSDLDKGASVDILSAILFGDWSKLILANWAGIDLIVDEITLADTAQIKMVVHSWWDINTRYPQSFAVLKDALAS